MSVQSHVQTISGERLIGRFSPGEISLLVGTTILGLAAMYMLTSDFSFYATSFKAKGAPVAVLTGSTNVVKYRPAGVPIWDAASIDEKLYRRDQIYTDQSSSARFTFNNGETVEVDENALIVIEQNDDQPAIDIKKGSVLAIASKENPNIQIRVGNARARLNGPGSAALIRVAADGTAAVSMLQGRGEINSRGQTMKINRNDAGEIDKQGQIRQVPSAIPLPIFPPGDDVIEQGANRQSFQWQDNVNAQAYRVQIFSLTDPENPIVNVETKATAANVRNLPPGKYQWRILALNRRTGLWERGVPRYFEVVGESVPQLLAPSDDQHFAFTAKGETRSNDDLGFSTLLDWEGNSMNGYRIQLSADAKFARLLVDTDTMKAPFQSPPLPEGTFYWRVRNSNPGKDPASVIWSNVRNFHVETDRIAAVPLRLTSASQVFVTDQFPLVSLDWSDVAKVNGYELQIAGSSDFAAESMIVAKRVDQYSAYQWQADRVGSIYWRIKPIDHLERPTVFSDPKRVDVVVGAVAITSPAPNSKVAKSAGDGSVLLSWRKQALATGYLVEVSRDSEFNNPIAQEKVSGNEFLLQNVETGKYFWRVKPQYADAALNNNARFTPPQPFEVVSPVAAVAVAPVVPVKPAKPVPPPVIVSSAEALTYSEGPSPVLVRWQKSGNAAAYQFQLAGDQTFGQMLHQEKTPATEARPTVGPGTYFVRVASLDRQGAIIGWSEPQKLQVRPVPVLGEVVPLTKGGVRRFAYRAKVPDVDFAWRRLAAAKNYEFQVATDPVFKKIALNDTFNKSTGAITKPLEKGTYYWRVRALDIAGRSGEWSKPLSVVVVQLGGRPKLIYPKAAMTASFDPDERRRIKFAWNVPSDLQNPSIVISQSSDFVNPVANRVVKGSSANVSVKGDGKYYWYVEGYDPRERVAVRSDVQEFNVQTTTIEKFKDVGERIRVEVGWIPGIWDYHHEVETRNDIDSSSTSFISGYAGIIGWINRHVGLDLETHVRRFTLKADYSQVSSAGGQATIDSTTTTYYPTHTDMMAGLAYRHKFTPNGYPISVNMRGGYYFNWVITFTPDETDGFVPVESSAHNLLIGAGVTLPVGSIFTLDGRLDYMSLLASDPVTLKNGKQYTTSWSFLHDFLSSGVMGYGVLYNTASYDYEDTDQFRGSVASSFLGFMYSIGLMF